MSAPLAKLPAWVDFGLIPLLNLLTAFLVAGVVVFAIGDNPLDAVIVLLNGAFGSGEGLGFTLFYATNFIFTGLSVAVAIHAGLFNIGSEGQAYFGGVGVVLAAMALDSITPWYITMLAAIGGGAIFGGAWAFLPAWLQARRGSHIVITTIMFNFLAFTLMNYLLVHVLKAEGAQSPETRSLLEGGALPKLGWLLNLLGMDIGSAPFNFSFLISLASLVAVWVLIWRTRLGFELRALGFNKNAAIYAGIPYARTVILAMLLSGALAGLMSMNSIMGDQQRMVGEFTGGAGFIGIAVSLMGRNHPVGIFFAAVLFGMLYQGGAELAFEFSNITRDIIVMIQGLVILFSGALEHMYRPMLVKLFVKT